MSDSGGGHPGSYKDALLYEWLSCGDVPSEIAVGDLLSPASPFLLDIEARHEDEPPLQSPALALIETEIAEGAVLRLQRKYFEDICEVAMAQKFWTDSKVTMDGNYKVFDKIFDAIVHDYDNPIFAYRGRGIVTDYALSKISQDGHVFSALQDALPPLDELRKPPVQDDRRTFLKLCAVSSEDFLAMFKFQKKDPGSWKPTPIRVEFARVLGVSVEIIREGYPTCLAMAQTLTERRFKLISSAMNANFADFKARLAPMAEATTELLEALPGFSSIDFLNDFASGPTSWGPLVALSELRSETAEIRDRHAMGILLEMIWFTDMCFLIQALAGRFEDNSARRWMVLFALTRVDWIRAANDATYGKASTRDLACGSASTSDQSPPKRRRKS